MQPSIRAKTPYIPSPRNAGNPNTLIFVRVAFWMQHTGYHSHIFLRSWHLSSLLSARNIRRQNTLHSVTAECRVLEFSEERQDIIRVSSLDLHVFLLVWSVQKIGRENILHSVTAECRVLKEIFTPFTIRHFECNTQRLRTLNLCSVLHLCGLCWSEAECRVPEHAIFYHSRM